MLNQLRTVAVTGLEIASAPGRHHLYARQLLGCLDAEARAHLWRLSRTALVRGGSLFLEFSAGEGPAGPDGLVRRLHPQAVVDELVAAGGRVVAVEEGPGLDAEDRPDPWTCRLQVRFDETNETNEEHVDG